MQNKQIQAMIRNPIKMMRFQTTGKTPQVTSCPTSPLRALLEQIPPREWSLLGGITIGDALGFRGRHHFHSVGAAMQWLGFHKTTVDRQTMPYQSYMRRGFTQPLTIELLLEHCHFSGKQADVVSHLRRCTSAKLWIEK